MNEKIVDKYTPEIYNIEGWDDYVPTDIYFFVQNHIDNNYYSVVRLNSIPAISLNFDSHLIMINVYSNTETIGIAISGDGYDEIEDIPNAKYGIKDNIRGVFYE